MNILVACEFSGRVAAAFRRRGHNAYSCDLEPSISRNAHHFQMPIQDMPIWISPFTRGLHYWDVLIAFPPCTYLTSANNMNPGITRTLEFKKSREDAARFFRLLTDADVPRICVENPIGYMNSHYRKPDQIIQPYEFGHPYSKATCLWLKGLPLLKPTQLVEPTGGGWASIGTRDPRKRSMTFLGVARAMAKQWSDA
jgi:hypothetical protein